MPVLPFDPNPDETVTATYEFRKGGDIGKRAVLTTRRLVMLTKDSRESHPLSQIRSVRVEQGRKTLQAVLLGALAGLMFGSSAFMGVGATIAGSNEVTAKLATEGFAIAAVALVFGLVCAALAVREWRGYANLSLELPAGARRYETASVDPDLLTFVERLERAL
jgi:hypothetical protein